MGAINVVLKKKLKRDSGKYWDKGDTIQVDQIRAKELEKSGHIALMEQPAKEAEPTTSKIKETEDKTDTNKTQ